MKRKPDLSPLFDFASEGAEEPESVVMSADREDTRSSLAKSSYVTQEEADEYICQRLEDDDVTPLVIVHAPAVPRTVIEFDGAAIEEALFNHFVNGSSDNTETPVGILNACYPGGLPDENGGDPTASTWREMPHEQFLRLTPRQQMEQCIARDEDSAMHASNAGDQQWYLERAAKYRAEMKGMN